MSGGERYAPHWEWETELDDVFTTSRDQSPRRPDRDQPVADALGWCYVRL